MRFLHCCISGSLLGLCSLVYFPSAHAQTLYTRDAKITVAPNTTLSVKGSVENEGTIVNNGHLKVGGPWLNSGLYEPGSGHITFNSTSKTVPQIIQHNGQVFSSITLSGGTKKIILSDIVIGKQVQFDHGIVEAAGDSRVILREGVEIITASDSSHVHGAVFQTGKGRKLFPIGNGSIYLPVELTDVTDPGALIGVEVFEFENGSLARSERLASISEKRYWYIDVASGSLANSPVVLPLRDESLLGHDEEIVVVQSDSPTDVFTSIGGLQKPDGSNGGTIISKMNVSMPFVALATAAKEEELVVYNAVSDNGDGLNEFLRIGNIETYPFNKLSVFNRWGDKVFEIENYDNNERVFRGRTNIGGESQLVTGTYFYVLDIAGQESLRGFIAVKN